MERHLKELEKSDTFETFNAILHAQFTLAQRIPTALICQILIFHIMLIYTIPLSPT